MKFRKRPVIVEATQWFPGLEVPGVFSYQPPDLIVGGTKQEEQRFKQEPYYAVRTAHGEITRIAPGDWIIAEPDGRGHYPCKPDIFAATYFPEVG